MSFRYTAVMSSRSKTACLIVAATCSGCTSDHHVSPWPRNMSLRTLMQPTSVEAHVARVGDEMEAEGLVLDAEVEGSFEDGEPFRILAFRGHDDLGNEKTALRVATRYGVVMALGPTTAQEALRGQTVSFVPSFGEGSSWASGSDINGDGLPDVLVQGPGGRARDLGAACEGCLALSDRLARSGDGRNRHRWRWPARLDGPHPSPTQRRARSPTRGGRDLRRGTLRTGYGLGPSVPSSSAFRGSGGQVRPSSSRACLARIAGWQRRG